MTAYYNEHDPYAAQWLRNLITAGHIAPGVVDERSIEDVSPADLSEYTQCHFFAGIGVWSLALRRAGWRDEWPIWTGSCPCQPFSAAGKGAGFADERHLWPAWHWLIEQCQPPIVAGEQVASKDGLQWLDLVSSDLEAAGYAFGASDLCAAGFGGAHIRQRLYFVGLGNALPAGWPEWRPEPRGGQVAGAGAVIGMANANVARSQGWSGMSECALERAPGSGSLVVGLAEADSNGRSKRQRNDTPTRHRDTIAAAGGDDRPGPTHAPLLGRNTADWLYCRDGKWRPVEPGTFPLVDAAPVRVGRLRAYGNGLDAETATQFVAAVMETLPHVIDYDL